MSHGAAVVAGVAAAGSAGAAFVAIVTRADRSVARRLAAASAGSSRGQVSVLRWALRGLARWPVVARHPTRAEVAGHLSLAGWDLTAGEFRAAQALAFAVAFWVAVVSVVALPSALPVVVVLPVTAWRVPGVVLARAVRRRRAMADRELPQFLDLLAAGSTAGLGPHGALLRAAGGTSGPLEQELRRFQAEVELGARWRDGLVRLSERLGLPDLHRAVRAMVRTERLGSSLADALRELADEVREERRQAAAERARKAPVKMLFPLVFMILPAFLLLTVVPVLISTLRSIR